MAAIGRNILTWLCFMTEIYLTISLSTHNGKDAPQNYEGRVKIATNNDQGMKKSVQIYLC